MEPGLAPRSLGARPRFAEHRVDRLVAAAPRTIASLRGYIDGTLVDQVEAMVAGAAIVAASVPNRSERTGGPGIPPGP